MSFFGMFIRFVLAFLLTVLVFYQLPIFPPVWSGVAAVCLAIFMALSQGLSGFMPWLERQNQTNQQHLRRSLNILYGIIIGWSWVFWQSFFTPVIAERYLNQPVFLTGQIIELPVTSIIGGKTHLKYEISVTALESGRGESSSVNASAFSVRPSLITPPVSPLVAKQSYQAWLKPRVVISWYLTNSELKALTDRPQLGETWRFRVKLKANHAAMNPGAVDYETWLFQKHISAKGYLKNYTKNERHLVAKTPAFKRLDRTDFQPFNRMRNSLSERLNQVFAQSPFDGFYRALTLGDKTGVSAEQWSVLQTTGTIHLMAISGLHMGIIALMGGLLFRGLWWLGVYRIEWINLPEFVAFGALLFSSVYLMLSGFAIPTQRAWLMVVSVLLFVVLRRKFQPWSALALAAWLIVLWDSRSLLSLGFWLSFLAVALIFSSLNWLKYRSKWQQLLGVQWLLTLGLAPLLMWAFHSVPSYSFIANLVAVPFITLLGLPWIFLASLIGIFTIEWGQWLISGLDAIWFEFWSYLQWVNDLPLSTISVGAISVLWMVGLYGLIFMGLASRSSHQRRWIIVVTLMFVGVSFMVNELGGPNRPQSHQAWLTVLDVGQGQATVIETQNHLVVYDTGAKWGDTMDGAKLALLPYLRSQGWHQIDQLIVSHSDLDHAGGSETLLKSMPVSAAISGQPDILNQRMGIQGLNRSFTQCQAGQRWQMDGVNFEILSPLAAEIGQTFKSDNDLSCVLKITVGDRNVLIPGDLSLRGEHRLLAEYGQDLRADLLIAGHHGSKTSSGQAWLDQVQPSKMVFTAGYLNRFNFPSSDTLARLAPMNLHWWNTACSGALTFEVTESAVNLMQEARKQRRKWYHHSCLANQQGTLFQ